jgi:phosphopantetheinyl transferase
MTTGANRALLETIGADLEGGGAALLVTRLPDSLGAETVEILRSTLDDADRGRYSHIQTERSATAFLVTRAIVRTVLGHLLGFPGRNVELLTSERGKPSLALSSVLPLYFNTSHSEPRAVVALSRVGDVGVDVEDIGTIDERVVRRSLSSDEFERLAAMDLDERRRAFFRLWTIKEACAKATGVGIGVGMRNVAATLDGSGRWNEYSWESIDLGPGLAAALAIKSPETDEARISVALHHDVLKALFGIDA